MVYVARYAAYEEFVVIYAILPALPPAIAFTDFAAIEMLLRCLYARCYCLLLRRWRCRHHYLEMPRFSRLILLSCCHYASRRLLFYYVMLPPCHATLLLNSCCFIIACLSPPRSSGCWHIRFITYDARVF